MVLDARGKPIPKFAVGDRIIADPKKLQEGMEPRVCGIQMTVTQIRTKPDGTFVYVLEKSYLVEQSELTTFVKGE